MKIILFVATRCHILKLNCTKFDVGAAYSAPQTPSWISWGLIIKAREERDGKGREGKGMEWRKEGREHFSSTSSYDYRSSIT